MLGSARLGSARLGSARLGSARLGSARLGSARLGSARLGSARLGSARRLLKFKHSVLRIFICIIFIELFVSSIRVKITKKSVVSRAGGRAGKKVFAR